MNKHVSQHIKLGSAAVDLLGEKFGGGVGEGGIYRFSNLILCQPLQKFGFLEDMNYEHLLG